MPVLDLSRHYAQQWCAIRWLTGGVVGHSFGEVARSGDRIALAAFVSSAVLAGGNAVGIRFSNRELAPLWGACVRFALAAVVLFAVMAVFRLSLPRGRALAGAVLFGALTVGISFALLYHALLRLQAGLVQTLLALVPLVTLLIAVAERQERLRLWALVGALFAMAGIAVMVNAPNLQGAVPLLSVLATLGSVLCAAQGGVLVRAFPPVHPVTMNAVAMATGALMLLFGSVLTNEPRVVPESSETWVALGFLAMFDSVVVSLLYLVVLRHWDASRASYLFVCVPVVTTALSAWLDDERLTTSVAIGGLLVLAGVYVGALRRDVPASPRPETDLSR